MYEYGALPELNQYIQITADIPRGMRWGNILRKTFIRVEIAECPVEAIAFPFNASDCDNAVLWRSKVNRAIHCTGTDICPRINRDLAVRYGSLFRGTHKGEHAAQHHADQQACNKSGFLIRHLFYPFLFSVRILVFVIRFSVFT